MHMMLCLCSSGRCVLQHCRAGRPLATGRGLTAKVRLQCAWCWCWCLDQVIHPNTVQRCRDCRGGDTPPPLQRWRDVEGRYVGRQWRVDSHHAADWRTVDNLQYTRYIGYSPDWHFPKKNTMTMRHEPKFSFLILKSHSHSPAMRLNLVFSVLLCCSCWGAVDAHCARCLTGWRWRLRLESCLNPSGKFSDVSPSPSSGQEVGGNGGIRLGSSSRWTLPIIYKKIYHFRFLKSKVQA